MNQEKIREKFPMLKNDIIFLDSGALVQKPIQVINAINDFYTKYSISNRTSDSELGIIVGQKIDKTRKMTADLLECSEEEIMFNSGTTEGLNYCAQLFSQLINEDDEILISKFNHSSNMIPWIEIAKEKKAKIIFSDDIINDINSKTKIIAYAQKNNSFNIQINAKELFEKAKKYYAFIINDAAQAISHEKVSAKYCDAIAFSSNKFFGPTGLGVLYVSKNILAKVSAKKYGGGAIDYINKIGNWKAKNSIVKHEPGTLNLAGIFGFYEAIIFFNSLDKKWMKEYLFDLSSYAYDKLSSLDNIKIVSCKGDSIILFEIKNSTSQDVASYLGHNNVYVRSGLFCAQYLNHIIENSLVRISLHIYNNKQDIDKLIEVLKRGGDFLDFI